MWKAQPVFFSFVISVLLSGCVEQFYPDESDMHPGLMVINAHISDEPAVQYIEVLRSNMLSDPVIAPETGCSVVLQREDGEISVFHPSAPGRYFRHLDPEFLQTGMSYRVRVNTADGEEYQSDYDRLRPAPDIDSIYYRVERHSYQSAGMVEEGIRFFIDFTYDREEYEFIRWELTETYEFHNPPLVRVVLRESPRRYTVLPDSSRPTVCYISRRIQDLHCMSMSELNRGVYINKPFDFVPNIRNEQKLHHKYALLVRQHSIGPEAYYYFNELKKTSQEQGFLFDSQPALLESNICNLQDPDEKVLGFFSMSGVRWARGIASELTELDRERNKYYCVPADRMGGCDVGYYPVYCATAIYDGKSVTGAVNKHCADCRAYEGSTDVKPDYW